MTVDSRYLGPVEFANDGEVMYPFEHESIGEDAIKTFRVTSDSQYIEVPYAVSSDPLPVIPSGDNRELDPLFDDVVFMVRGDEPDESTTIVDRGPGSVTIATTSGSPKYTDDDVFAGEGTSLNMIGGAWAQSATLPSLGDFTVEMRVKYGAYLGTGWKRVGNWKGTNGYFTFRNNGIWPTFVGASPGQLAIPALADGEELHITYMRAGSTAYFWANGVYLASAASFGGVSASPNMRFGHNSVGTSGAAYAGPIAVRVTDGARYTAGVDHAVPAAPWQGADDAPLVTSQPASVVAYEGDAAVFTVAATELNPTNTFQWYKSGVGAIAGATSTTLELLDTQPDDDLTYYYCVITGGNGKSVQSDSAGLTVISAASMRRRYIFEDHLEPIYKRGKCVLSTALDDGERLHIRRETPIENPFTATALKPLLTEALEHSLDQICYIQQELEGHLCDCRGEEFPGIPEISPPTIEWRPECEGYVCNALERFAATIPSTGFWPFLDPSLDPDIPEFMRTDNNRTSYAGLKPSAFGGTGTPWPDSDIRFVRFPLDGSDDHKLCNDPVYCAGVKNNPGNPNDYWYLPDYAPGAAYPAAMVTCVVPKGGGPTSDVIRNGFTLFRAGVQLLTYTELQNPSIISRSIGAYVANQDGSRAISMDLPLPVSQSFTDDLFSDTCLVYARIIPRQPRYERYNTPPASATSFLHYCDIDYEMLIISANGNSVSMGGVATDVLMAATFVPVKSDTVEIDDFPERKVQIIANSPTMRILQPGWLPGVHSVSVTVPQAGDNSFLRPIEQAPRLARLPVAQDFVLPFLQNFTAYVPPEYCAVNRI